MVYKCVFVLFLFYFDVILCINIGDPCTFNKTAGVCKSINECPIAMKILYQDEKKPHMCKWEDDLRIVCCPTKDVFYETGVFRDYFFDSNNGIKQSKDMACHYTGVQPLICCPKTREADPPREPDGCPKLSRPRINTAVQHFAWEKCLDYQQYFYKCVNKFGKPDEYVRVNTCGGFRIAGGSEARAKEFPHMALLGCRNTVSSDPEDVVWIGGGSLISEKYILTAAHVLLEPTHGSIKYALLGALNKTDTKNGALYNIVRRIPYPTYQSGSLNYDIALVELETRVRFSEFIRPACLPVPGREIESDRIIAGWGVTGSLTTSELLMTAKILEASSSSLCSKLRSKNFEWMGDAMICAVGQKNANKNHHADSCKGDSGGPLMALMTNIQCSYSIEGVVSWGPTCGQGHPGIYTRVAYYLPWIMDNVWPEFASRG